MGRSHGCSGDGVDGMVTGVPNRENVETWCEEVDTLAPVGKVGSLVGDGRGSNCDGILGGSRAGK